jgi:hypothetical protein
MGLALQVFAAVRQVATASSMWCIAEDHCLQPHLFHVSKQPAVVLMLPWWVVCENTKSPNTLFYLRKGDNVSGNRKHTPQTNGLGKYVLFPCIALYMDVSIDILKGNSFYIGV